MNFEAKNLIVPVVKDFAGPRRCAVGQYGARHDRQRVHLERGAVLFQSGTGRISTRRAAAA